jgi:hypothetical protein
MPPIPFYNKRKKSKTNRNSSAAIISLKVGKYRAQHAYRHLLALQRLAVGDLPELLHYIGIAVGHGVGQHIVNAHAKPVDEPYERFQREAPLSPLNGAHISVGYVNRFRQGGLRQVQAQPLLADSGA